MKKIILFALLLAFITPLCAQAPAAVFKNASDQVFFVGADNPLHIQLQNVPDPDAIRFLCTNDASVGRTPDGYILRASRPGKVEVQVIADVNGEEEVLAKRRFEVKPLPATFVAPVGVETLPKIEAGANGPSVVYEIQREELANIPGLFLTSDASNAGRAAEIKSYSMTLVFKKTDPVEFQQTGATFSENARAALSALEPGSSVYFENIEVWERLGGRQSLAQANSIILKVK